MVSDHQQISAAPDPIRNTWFSLLMRLLVFCLFFCSTLSAQLALNVNNSANELAQKIVGPGYRVSNAKLIAPNGSIGTFKNQGSNIGISDGILLSTGLINIAKGPNDLNSAGFNHGASGDLDLSILSNDSATYDGVSLEFDLVPACSTLSIEYVFASEEYNEYVGEEFNDVFAFFISGPGINGVQNIALVPGTNLPININNINAGVNSSYFVNNASGTSIQYDGFTKPILAKANVIACQTYHLKIVIADCMDGIFDSAIFIKGETIQCFPSIYVDEAYNTDAITTCSKGNFTFCRTGPQTNPLLVRYKIEGTAKNELHYEQIPDSIIIPAGKTCASVTIKPVVLPGVTGKFSLRIIYPFGPCPEYDTLTLAIISVPPIDAGPDLEICSGDSVQIGSIQMPDNTYLWKNSVGLNNPNIADPYLRLFNTSASDQVTKYVLWVTNPLIGNCILKDSLNVRVRALPSANFTAKSDYCTGEKIIFTDKSIAGPGKKITEWYWDFGDNSFSKLQGPSITPSIPGLYKVSLTVKDNAGCKNEYNTPVNIWPRPKVDFTSNIPCSGEAVKFENNTSIESGTIEKMVWNFGDGSPLINGNSPSHLYPSSANSFQVLLIATSDKNCVGTAQKTILLKPKPEVNFNISASNICIGDSLNFLNTSNGISEKWSFGDGVFSNLKNPRHAYSQSGKYPVKLVAVSSFGCADSLSKTINVTTRPKFNFVAQDTAGCTEFCTSFFAKKLTGSDSILSWKWIFNSQSPLSGNKVNYCYNKPGDYPVSLIANTAGCADTLAKASYIQVYPSPIADFSLYQQSASVLDSVVYFSDASSSDVISWIWNFGDGKTSNLKNPPPHAFSFERNEYPVYLIVTNSSGCKDSSFRNVFLDGGSFVYAPNTFSPDDDGNNDVFKPSYTGIYASANQEMYIYDRWGLQLFHTNNLKQGWDGRAGNGQTHKSDFYVYHIFFWSKEDGSLLKKMIGKVLLLR